MPTPLMLTARSQKNVLQLMSQLGNIEDESSACVWDTEAFTLLCSITQSLQGRWINLVTLDLSKLVMPLKDLLQLFRIPTPDGGGSPFFCLRQLSAVFTQVSFPTGTGESKVDTATEVQPPPVLDSAELCSVPNVQMNCTYLGELMHLVSHVSRLTLRDRDSYVAHPNDSWYTWYCRGKFPTVYPNLTDLKVTVFSEFLSVLTRARPEGLSAWFPLLKTLNLHAHGNYICRRDLEKYREALKDIDVVVDKNVRFFDGGPQWERVTL
ncbi:unnamed protein product [Dibothriocephalus latus]|uniref:Uncharacterized protein n=1 Tax=Dibothriocephalus latus TaxID=60516 RepID=A0A3P7M1N4_DIBLA|nr:unnamed protein product [Dibothriocephalus latus]